MTEATDSKESWHGGYLLLWQLNLTAFGHMLGSGCSDGAIASWGRSLG
jgi:hypothetical protein